MDTWIGTGQRDFIFFVFPQLQFIANIDGLKNGAQGMVTVGPFPGNFQAQIDFSE
jgi:hypothetical protein